MKKLIVGSAVIAACMAGPAVGADLPAESPIYVERPPDVGLLNWTGFYFGANLGYARSPGSTDILITEAYRWAFIRHERYGLAAAYATLIFIILLAYSLITMRLSRGTEDTLE